MLIWLATFFTDSILLHLVEYLILLLVRFHKQYLTYVQFLSLFLPSLGKVDLCYNSYASY